MEVNGEINNAHFLTLEANNAYAKFKGPKTHNRQISWTNIVFSPNIFCWR